ncbi:hypothetical protein BCV60_05485 [Bacillus halotolerans]|nr:hypothetical protein BCV60_05485 [Bacillus halotolerans]
MILSFHGEDGKFILPELGQEVYEKNEPRSCYFGPEEVRAYADLQGVHVLATGCYSAYDINIFHDFLNDDT